MTSVSTLFREARKTKNPTLAKKLRKQAAKLRKQEADNGARITHRALARGGRKHRQNKGNGHDPKGRTTDRPVTWLSAETADERVAEAVRKASRDLEDKHSDQMRILRERHHIDVVSSFIADMEALAYSNGNMLPASVVLSGVVLARIVAQLREDGFDATGKKGFSKSELSQSRTM